MMAMNTGRPIITMEASFASVENMNTMINRMLMISRMELIIPLERISETELT